jgi:serine/threonine protein kinase
MTKLGTLQWVAPEVLRDERYSEKADIYSFAILIWELVAKAVPYVGQNSLMVARAVAYKSLRPVIPHTCPDLFRDLMTTCWQDDAEKRPSFKEILAVLDNIDSETANSWIPLPESQKK